MVARLALIAALALAPLIAQTPQAGVAGDWRVTIVSNEGTITGRASLKIAGHAVTGWVGPSEDDPIPVTGTLSGNTLTLKTHPQPGRTVAFDECKLKVNPGKMTGTIDTSKGTIEFVRATH